MATSAVSPVASSTDTSNSSNTQAATNAFGLSFNSLLQVILTQLTYQDPLKPMDNFQFVSQLAQFTQIEQGQSVITDLQSLGSSQTATEAAALLGRTVDVTTSSTTLTGEVTAIALSSGAPQITIKTSSGQTISGLAMTTITQIRPAQ